MSPALTWVSITTARVVARQTERTQMSETVLLVGTKKGLWIGRSDAARRTWEWSEPEFLMQGIYGLGIDTRGPAPRLLVSGTSEHWGPGDLPLRRPGPHLERERGRLGPVPRRPGQQRRAGLADPARRPRRARRRVGRDAAVGAVPLGGPRRDVHAGPVALGPPAPDAVGRGLRRPGDPHDRAAPDRSAAADRGHVDRRGLPHRTTAEARGRRPTRGSRRTSSPTRGRSSASACTRWPPTRRRRSGCSRRTTTASTAPTTAATGGCRSPTGCRPTSASRSWCTRTSPTRSTSSRWSPTARASRPTDRPGCGARPTPARPGPRRPPGLPDGFWAAVMRDAMTTDQADQAGLYVGARDGTVYASLDDGESWTQIAAHLPDVLSVRAAVV